MFWLMAQDYFVRTQGHLLGLRRCDMGKESILRCGDHSEISVETLLKW